MGAAAAAAAAAGTDSADLLVGEDIPEVRPAVDIRMAEASARIPVAGLESRSVARASTATAVRLQIQIPIPERSLLVPTNLFVEIYTKKAT